VGPEDLEVLARRAARGDDAAVEAVCRALQDDVWRYCHALLGDREQAFDAAQDTFLRAVRGFPRFRGDAPVRLWVLAIARRAAADLIRGEVRRRGRQVLGDVPDHGVADGAGRLELEQLVAALPGDLGQAFVLTQVLGLSYAEAGEVAGCPVGTVRSRVFRARQRLVAALDGEPEEGSDAVG
jgi:RNA polymerase sigma-70 factor, ECF subfamily